jgi:hypothetical protein
MSTPKNGDRVQVALEGEVISVCSDSFYVSGSWVHLREPGVSFTIIRPAVKVGDVIETAEELDALPLDTAVLNKHGTAIQKDSNGWFSASSHGDALSALDAQLPATVLYAPDAAA